MKNFEELTKEEEYEECLQEIKDLNDEIEWWSNRFKAVERDNREYKARIDKAKAKLQNMFDNGDENKILDDLLELDKILGSDKE